MHRPLSTAAQLTPDHFPMRLLLILLLATVTGIAIGYGMADWRMRHARWDGRPTLSPEPDKPPLPLPGEPAPRLMIDGAEHKFGTMSSSEERTHDFVFSNTGAAPLVLKAGSTSCRCTLSSLDKTEIPPGGSAKLTLRWKTRELTGPFRQSAMVYTNDPARPEVTLVVTGEVTVAVRAEPEELVFTRLMPGQSATGEVRLRCTLPNPALEIPEFVLSDKDIAQFFDVQFLPLPADQLRSDPYTRSGVIIRVTVKPGLPQGPFQQTMLLRTNLESAPAITVPIKGIVESEVSVAGLSWDATQGIVDFGMVPKGEEAERRLTIILRGQDHKEVQLVRFSPDSLRVKLGPTTVIGGGTGTQTSLIIQIPKGSPPANYLGSEPGRLGEIILKTHHPQIPQLRILVRFAIEG